MDFIWTAGGLSCNTLNEDQEWTLKLMSEKKPNECKEHTFQNSVSH